MVESDRFWLCELAPISKECNMIAIVFLIITLFFHKLKKYFDNLLLTYQER